MQSLICNFESSLERCSSCHDPEVAVRCLEIAAAFGGRWRPDSHAFRYFRQSVGQASPNSVVSRISRIVKAGAIEQDVFRELMNTKKMTEVLNSGGPGSVFLREFAGQTLQSQPRNKRYKIAAATYNISQLMRHLMGIGTPKQAAARVKEAFHALFGPLQMPIQAAQRAFQTSRTFTQSAVTFLCRFCRFLKIRTPVFVHLENTNISTG